MKAQTVAAVVVTYNRRQLLIECLRGIRAQVAAVDKIFVIDNASSDETQRALAEAGYLCDSAVAYVRLPANVGGAGGFYEGIKRAYDGGFDWIWVMDDDAEPRPCALEEMLPLFTSRVSAVAALKIGLDGVPQFNHHGWFAIRRMSDRIVRAITTADLRESSVDIEFSSFVGLALNRMAVDLAGLPKKEFFIHFDDVEYCVRLNMFGPIVLAVNSVIVHKSAAIGEIQAKKIVIGHRTVSRLPVDKLWITYFGYRNLVWLKMRDSWPLAVMFVLKSYLIKLLHIVMLDDHKLLRSWFYFNALMDGFFSRFDNSKPGRLLRRVAK